MKKQIFRWGKWLLPILLLAFLLCLIGVLFFIQRPISSSIIDRKIQQAWIEVTGLPLSFQKATFRIAKGQASLTNIRIKNPQETEDWLGIQKIILNWDWLPNRWARPLHLSSVEISGLEPIKIILDSRMRPVLDERGRAVQELLQRLGGKAEQPKQSLVARDLQVKITDVPVQIYQSVGNETRLLSDLTSPWISYQHGRKGIWSINGRALIKGAASPLSFLDFEVRSPGKELPFSYSLAAESLLLPDQFKVDLPMNCSTGRFQCKGSIRIPKKDSAMEVTASLQINQMRSAHQPTSFTLNAGLLNAEMRLALQKQTMQWDYNLSARDLSSIPQPGTHTLKLAAMKSNGKGVYNLEKKALHVQQFALNALNSEVQAAGKGTFQRPYPYQGAITKSIIGPEALDWIHHAFPFAKNDIHFSQGSMRLKMQFAGNQRRINWQGSRGSILFHDVRMDSDRLNAPVHITGNAAWTTETLALSQLNLEAVGNRLLLKGTMERNPKAKRRGLAFHTDWKTDLDLQKLMNLLPRDQIAQMKDLKLNGKISGAGSARGEWRRSVLPQSRKRASFWEIAQKALQETFQVNGDLQLNIAQLDHPALPGPVQNLKGGLLLQNQSAEFQKLRAEMLDSSITLSGSLRGKPYFWSQNARADIAASGAVDLSRAGEAVGAGMKQRAFYERLRPEGRLAGTLHFQGPIHEPKKFFVTGDVEAESISCRIDSRFTQGELRQANASLRFFPDRLVIDNLDGKIRTINFSANGIFYPNACDLKFATTGFITDYRSIVPRLVTPRLDLAGKAALDGRLTLKMKNGASHFIADRPIRSFLKSLDASIASIVWNEVTPAKLNEQFDWSLLGSARMEDVTIAHLYAPAPVTHVNGEFVMEGTEIRTKDGVNLQWGSSPGQGSGSLGWMPEGHIKAVLQGKFPSMVLDEWFLKWGSGRRKPDPPNLDLLPMDEFYKQVDSPEARRFVLDASISADHATFKQFDIVKGGTAHFIYTKRRKPVPSSMRFENIDLRPYGGKASGNLAFLFIRRAQWATDLHIENVDTKSLMTAALRKESTVSGQMNADAQVQGRSKRRHTFIGEGSFSLQNSRFLRDPIFTALGYALNSDDLRDIAFSDLRGTFSMAKGIVDLKHVKFFGTLLQLEADGQVGLDRTMDIEIIYRFLGPIDAILGRIPVLKVIPKIVNRLGEVLLKVHVGGSAEDPKVTIVPLSADDLRILQFEPVQPQE